MVVLGVLAVSMGRKDAGCTLTASGVGLMATKFKQGATAQVVIATVGPIAANEACKSLVRKLDADPTEEHTLEVVAPDGNAKSVEVSKSRILAPAPPPPPNTLGRIVECWSSYRDSQFMRDVCIDGIIAPR